MATSAEMDAPAVRTRLAGLLEEAVREELRAGRAVVGPHLDGLDILLEGRPAASFGSQGQQRIVSLSLKFVELQVIIEQTDVVPVFLLDDITSELDSIRNRFLTRRILEVGCQVFVTTTSPDHLPVGSSSDVAMVRMVSGNVLQESAA